MPDFLTRLPACRRLLSLTLAAALALTGAAVGLVTATPAAAVGVGVAVGAQEATLRERVARLDGAIARTEADLVAADARAATAAESYSVARVTASAARRSAVAASAAADDAAAALVDAEADLALVVSQAYRQSGESPLLLALTSAEGAGDALDRASTVDRLAAQRDAAVARVTAAALVSASRADRAGAAAARATTALDEVGEAADVARREQELVDERARDLLGERRRLLGELADLQATTLAAEQERQAVLADARTAAANAAYGRGPVVDHSAATGLEPSSQAPARPAPLAPPAAAPPAAAPPAAAPPAAAPPAAAPPAAAPPAAAPSTAPTAAPIPRPAPSPAPSPPPAPRAPAPTSAPVVPPSPAPPPPPVVRAPPPPAGNSAGSAAAGISAVEWARTQLGKAYLWGGEGPDAYDCSGLLMRAWGQAGVSLPHSSRLQYAKSAKISPDQLRPGDLIFWGSDPNDPSSIHHVAMYAGGGKVIEAPNSRSVVREVPVRWAGTMPMVGRP